MHTCASTPVRWSTRVRRSRRSISSAVGTTYLAARTTRYITHRRPRRAHRALRTTRHPLPAADLASLPRMLKCLNQRDGSRVRLGGSRRSARSKGRSASATFPLSGTAAATREMRRSGAEPGSSRRRVVHPLALRCLISDVCPVKALYAKIAFISENRKNSKPDIPVSVKMSKIENRIGQGAGVRGVDEKKKVRE